MNHGMNFLFLYNRSINYILYRNERDDHSLQEQRKMFKGE